MAGGTKSLAGGGRIEMGPLGKRAPAEGIPFDYEPASLAPEHGIVPPLQPLQALVVDIAEPEDVRQHDPFGIEPAPLRNDPDAVEGKTLQPLRPLGREVSLQPDKIPLALQLGFQLARVRP